MDTYPIDILGYPFLSKLNIQFRYPHHIHNSYPEDILWYPSISKWISMQISFQYPKWYPIHIHDWYPCDILRYPNKIYIQNIFWISEAFIPPISRDIQIYPNHLSIISLYIHDCHGNSSCWRRHSHARSNGSVGCLGTDSKLLLRCWTPRSSSRCCPHVPGLLKECGLRDREATPLLQFSSRIKALCSSINLSCASSIRLIASLLSFLISVFQDKIFVVNDSEV